MSFSAWSWYFYINLLIRSEAVIPIYMCTNKYLIRVFPTGDAYSKRGRILAQYILKPTSNGIPAFLVSRWQLSLLFAFLMVCSVLYFQLRLFCCHTSSNLNVGTLSRYTSFFNIQSVRLSWRFLEKEITYPSFLLDSTSCCFLQTSSAARQALLVS